MNCNGCERTWCVAQKAIAGAAAVVLLFLELLPLRADVVTNLNPVADTALLESNTNNNLGALANVPSGTTPQGRSRALLKFDLTQIPVNATITSASLVLNVTTVPGGGVGSIFALDRILKDWGEGIGGPAGFGSPANVDEATWSDRFYPSTPWSMPGGASGLDFVTNSSSTNFVDGVGSYLFASTAATVADAQLWLNNPGTNFGWLLISENEATPLTVRRFATREDPVHAPVLSVAYIVPSPVIPPVISSLNIRAGQVTFSFQAETNRTYTIQFCGFIAGASWLTLTNIPAQPVAGPVFVSDPLNNSGYRFYRVRTP